MEFISQNLQDTITFANEFAKSLKDGDVVALVGDLGAGKTTFVKAVCSALGVKEDVTSPTFTLLNEYMGRIAVYHFDMYRLKSPVEAIDSGLDEILRAGNGVCFVEWPEKIAGLMPEAHLTIEILSVGETERKFIITEAK